jgi:hypothetical protein
MCIELGLHRQKRSSKVSLRSELNKRLFWCCYWWDREITIALGRPPSISDHDIDVEVRWLSLEIASSHLMIQISCHQTSMKRIKTWKYWEGLRTSINLPQHIHKPQCRPSSISYGSRKSNQTSNISSTEWIVPALLNLFTNRQTCSSRDFMPGEMPFRHRVSNGALQIGINFEVTSTWVMILMWVTNTHFESCSNLLIDTFADGFISQERPSSTPTSPLRAEHRPTILGSLRRSLSWSMPDIQKIASENTTRVYFGISAIGVSCRSYARLLYVAWSQS